VASPYSDDEGPQGIQRATLPGPPVRAQRTRVASPYSDDEGPQGVQRATLPGPPVRAQRTRAVSPLEDPYRLNIEEDDDQPILQRVQRTTTPRGPQGNFYVLFILSWKVPY